MAIQEAKEEYRRIFENLKDMVYVTSVDGKFIDVNQAGIEMLGYESKEELMQIQVKNVYFNQEDRKRFQDEIAKEGFVKDFETRLKRKDGTPIDVLITGSVRRNDSGEIIGYEGIIKNISERKRIEEELFQRTDELQILYELSGLINQSLNLDTVFKIALERASDLTGFEMGAIYLYNENEETLELKSYKGCTPAFAEKVRFIKFGEGVSGKVVELKQPISISIDEYSSHRILPFLKEEGIQSLVGIPLLAKGRAIGAITLSSRSFHHIAKREVHLLESIGNQIGLAIENARLFSAVINAKSEWETTFDAVTDLITVRDKDYRIIRANQAAFKRFGLEPEQMIGKKCFETLHQSDQPCEGCYISKTLEAKRSISGERESKYLNGIFQYYTFPIYDDKGEVVAVVDLAREITEKKRLERENEVVNNIYKILASSLDVRVVWKAVHSELKRVMDSQRMTFILLDGDKKEYQYYALEKDYEDQELINGRTYPLKNTFAEEVMKTGKPMLVSNMEEIEEGRYWIRERLLKEGIRSLLVFPLNYQEKVFGIMSLESRMTDSFSERHIDLLRQIAPGLAISIKNALLLDEIRGSEERYRTVVEGAHEGICVIGMDNRFRFVNKRMAEIQGYPLEELIGMDFRDFLTEESKQLIRDRFDQWERGEKLPSSFELNLLRKDGEIRSVEINSRVMKAPEGDASYIVFVRDITEHRRMEEQLLQNEKLRALGEMASGVAHDFNNALAAILGNTQILLYTAKDEETREALKTIEKVAKDCAQTVKRLQDFTRKKVEQKLFHLDINAIVRDVIEITKPKWKDEAQRKGFRIDMNSHLEEVSDVEANPSEMREVITNIILNAIEAMPEGGKIEIRTFEKDQEVYLQIADTGIGMTEGVKKKIFEPFFTTKPFTNTGLGLSVSYGIIKRFGGEIQVQSKVGSGTTFTIVLPASGEKSEEMVPDSVPKGVRSARILIIDDEQTVREVLSKILSQFNHQVTVAESGEEGIRLFGEKKFDLVLTDLGMPGMSGWEVCKSIKGIEPSIPVGMITGWGLEVDECQKQEVGLDFIITKPFNFDEVIRMVSKKI